MTEVNEARKIILDNCTTTAVDEMPLLSATGFVLAEPVYSAIDTPPFDQSAMDGFAFSFDKWDKKSALKVVGEERAGDDSGILVKQQEAVRIFTGAPLPHGADTVVMQEKVSDADGGILIEDAAIAKGSNVRPKASQTKMHRIALPAGHYLSPASIAFLAGIGTEKVKVYSHPKISIIVTGSELTAPGTPLERGKIYESNSFGLAAALHRLHIQPAAILTTRDDREEIREAIQSQLDSDIILLSAGISVGDYDFVAGALEDCGVKKIFHKVKQKPGKPLYFGRYRNSLVFGLPGNPASALTCFYEYVQDAILCSCKKETGRKIVLPLLNDYTKRKGLTYFLKGKIANGGVEILKHQESYLMNSFAEADCLVELEEGKENFQKGEPVKVRMIV